MALLWSKEAISATEPIDKAYSKSLRAIALGLATSERSERVLVKHVEEAARLLAAHAHDMKPWYKRHETEVAVGGSLIGLSASVPDFITGFVVADSPWLAITAPIMILLIGSGLLLAFHGILCGRGYFG